MKKVLFIMMLGLMFGQSDVSQKIINITVEAFTTATLEDLFPQYNLDWALINIIECSNDECALYTGENHSVHMLKKRQSNYIYDALVQNISSFYLEANNLIEYGSNISGIVSMTLLVTAEFPQEDTGYIEEGYEYCLNEGFNLVSYPCDNSIPIAQAIPNGENFINSIIGEGVASQYLDGAGWVGNLINLQSGDGYWFEANTTTCFQYECSE